LTERQDPSGERQISYYLEEEEIGFESPTLKVLSAESEKKGGSLLSLEKKEYMLLTSRERRKSNQFLKGSF